MKKLPFLILVSACVLCLLGGVFFGSSSVTLADLKEVAFSEESSAEAVSEFNTADQLLNFINSYSLSSANATVALGDVSDSSLKSVFDMSEKVVNKTIGDKENPFCGTFDGKGHIIANLTIDMSSSGDPEVVDTTLDAAYVGLFGNLGPNAKIRNLTFQNLKIKTGKAKTIYVGAIAFAENAEISNVKILSATTGDAGAEFEADQAETLYLGGLFGYAKSCKISGIQIGSDINFQASKAESAYLGGLVGKAEGSKFSNIQISSTSTSDLRLSLLGKLSDRYERENFEFDFNLNFGGFAGCLENSSVLNIVCRTSSFGDAWNFVRKDAKIHNLGGVVGTLVNSSIYFGICKSNFNVFVEEYFNGTINLGGIAGAVSQANSTILNVGMKNTFQTDNRSSKGVEVLAVGEVVGKIMSPVPQAANLSYIHFSKNNGVELFGNTGAYVMKNSRESDFLTPSGDLDLDNMQQVDGNYSYFSQQKWNSLVGSWDFVSTWFVSGQRVYLQNFYSNFSVTMSNFDTNTLIFKGIDNNGENVRTVQNLEYGRRVEIEFAFKTLAGGAKMSEFFDLATLRYNGNDVARFIKVGDEYKLSGTELYDIEMVKNADVVTGFKIIIKSMSRATSGSYMVSVTSKKFSAVITTRLYGGENDEVWNADVSAPGMLQSDNGTLRDVLPLSGMTYGAEYHIRTQAKPVTEDGEIYAPTGDWFIVTSTSTDEEGNVTETIKQIGSEYIKDGILSFTFGEGDFKGNLNIYAKYTSTACTGIFTFDEGVQKIALSNNSIIVETTGDKKPISKDDPTLSLDLYILKGYEFDYERFIGELEYSSNDPTTSFCTFLSQEELEDTICYHFSINMKTTNWDNYGNKIQIKVKTTKIEIYDMTWVWWVVGFVGGALVIAGIVVLIVWLVRRNRFGGGKKMKFDKKSYKNMYY